MLKRNWSDLSDRYGNGVIMQLEQFNQVSVDTAKLLLKQCAAIASWGDYVVKQRPFASVAALYQCAEQQAQHWQWEEVAQALALHPRIGQQRAAHSLSAKEQQFSAQEQQQLQLDQQLAQALAEANQRYEAQFGHIFLIRAKGRSATEILAHLQRRLSQSQSLEQMEVMQQLAEIALIRLKQEVPA
jgi:2-oxo-4-hydroxy-4-carboxy-5-ureidoimidazoline decarboxylase